MENKQSIHEKAIRLIEGGIVVIKGHFVMLAANTNSIDPCFYCDMDSLCHFGSEMQLVCRECDIISQKDCSLVFYESNNDRP